MPARRTSDGSRTPVTLVREPGVEAVTVTATVAQNEFGRLLDSTAYGRIVVITKHNEPRAVLVSMDRYNVLAKTRTPNFDELEAEWEERFQQMQTPESRAAAARAFASTPEELGAAAVWGAQQDKARGEAEARAASKGGSDDER